jgi:hypothetical protein
MGRVISARGAADDIFEDTKTAHTKGAKKSGKFATITLDILGPVVLLIDTIDTDLAEAKKTAAPLLAELEAANEEADDLVQRVYDEVWNDVGRPAYDRALTLIFPGGATYYTDGNVDTQPGRMELLAQLLERGIHPKLTKAQAQAAADKIRAGAAMLQAAINAARMPANQCSLLDRIRTATGRVVQFELANYKRALVSAGYSETEIHDVIPDRTPKKKAAPKTEPKAEAKAEPSGGEGGSKEQ